MIRIIPEVWLRGGNGMKIRRWLAKAMTCVVLVSQLLTPEPVPASETETCPDGQHQWVLDASASYPATCTENGLNYFRCAVCSAGEMTEIIPAAGHSFGPWTTVTEPTCQQEGSQVRICSACGAEEQQSTGMGSHQYGEWVTVAEPDCRQEGLQQRVCAVCGDMETSSLGYGDHNYTGWVLYQEGNCVEQGIYSRYCIVCGDYDLFYTGYGDHRYGDWQVQQEATCTQEGVRVRTCYLCGTQETEVTGMLAHSYGDWQVRQKASCTQEGIRFRTCTVCQAEDTEVSGMLAHTYGDWTVTKKATAFSQGERERSCSVCKKTEKESFDPEGTLRRGDRGEAVVSLQKALNEAGCDCGNADGIFGVKTEAAVSMFERSHEMKEDGIAWPGVQAVLQGREPESEMEGQTEARTQAQTETETEHTEAASEAQSETETEAQPETETGTEPEAQPETETEAQSETETGTEKEAKPETETETEAQTEIETESETQTGDKDTRSALSLICEEISVPENGSWYTEGEMVEYLITASNSTDSVYRNMMLYEARYNGALWGQVQAECESGSSETAMCRHQVTRLDVEEGTVSFWGYAKYLDEEGNEQTAYSNMVRVETASALEPSVDVRSDGKMTAALRILSSPANGSFYTEGETIRYELDTENGTAEQSRMTGCVLSGGHREILCDLPGVAPLEKQQFYYDYMVTKEDVEAGYVLSFGTVTWIRSDSDEQSEMVTPAVFADTDGIQEDLEKAGMYTGTELEDDSFCTSRLTGENAHSCVYEIQYDNVHGAIAAYILEAVGQAKTEEERIDARKMGQALWMAALDNMYTLTENEAARSTAGETDGEVRADADYSKPEKSERILNEKAAFYRMAAAWRSDLELLYPDEPETVARKLAELYEMRCLDMCIELHTAPGNREDSMMRDDITQAAVSEDPQEQWPGYQASWIDENTTMLTVTWNEEGTQRMGAIRAMLKDAKEHPELFTVEDEQRSPLAEAWEKAQSFWLWEDNTLMTQRFILVSGDGLENMREVLYTSRKAFREWLTARGELLDVLYPDQPEICEELLSRARFERVLAMAEAL